VSPKLSGVISDRLRKMFAPDAEGWNPPRGTPPPPKGKGQSGQSLGGKPGRKAKPK
jgi:hypothetical protein